MKTDDGWELKFLPGTNNTLYLNPCKNQCTFDLSLGRYRDRVKVSKLNPVFYLHFLADRSSVKFDHSYFILRNSGDLWGSKGIKLVLSLIFRLRVVDKLTIENAYRTDDKEATWA